ncbi:MAG: peptidyl-prolyl cis-trans isomerase [Planctomycetes bacterium]|nr:peptidyl-prolyl cis-trans isomerase [Planctomycetota bacterium]
MKGWFSAILLLSGFAFGGVLWAQSRNDRRDSGEYAGSWRDHPSAQYAPPRQRYASPQPSAHQIPWSEADRDGPFSGPRVGFVPLSNQDRLFGPPPVRRDSNSPVRYPDTDQPIQRRDPPSNFNADRRRPPQQPRELEPIKGSRVMARVALEVILEGDVFGSVDATMAPYVKKLEEARGSGSMPEAQYRQQKKQLADVREQRARQVLNQMIETKLIFADVRRKLPPERMEKLLADVGKRFEKEGIKELMKRLGVRSRIELDAALRSNGTSLEASKRVYVESLITGMWMQREVNVEKIVSSAELISYYEQNGSEFDNIGRARWQQLSIRFENTPSRDEAHRMLARLGNRVLRNEAFEAVAKDGSQGFTADEGGNYGWTTQGSLSSKTLDEAIFTLKVGQMSRIIEDVKGLHIVRVMERVDSNRTSFSEVQDKIRETILQQRRQEALAAFKTRIRQDAIVWTVYDEQDRQQQERIGRRLDARPTDRFGR